MAESQTVEHFSFPLPDREHHRAGRDSGQSWRVTGSAARQGTSSSNAVALFEDCRQGIDMDTMDFRTMVAGLPPDGSLLAESPWSR